MPALSWEPIHWLGEFSWGRQDWLALFTSLALIAAAEMGDKSQLVCMTLAARHRPWPVALGAVLAFAVLNALAVVFGAAVAAWLPRWLVALAVAGLFAGFGIHALASREEEEEGVAVEWSGHGIFFTTLAMIFMAEFGDKTQIAVAGLSVTLPPVPVWIGSTLALALTSILGVVAGRTLLRYLTVTLIHRIGGVIFLILAILALVQGLPWERIWQVLTLFLSQWDQASILPGSGLPVS